MNGSVFSFLLLFVVVAILPTHFVLIIVEIGSSFIPRSPWTMIFLFVLPCIARMTDACHHAQKLVKMGSHKLFAWTGLE
jgi:hypothetical protein